MIQTRCHYFILFSGVFLMLMADYCLGNDLTRLAPALDQLASAIAREDYRRVGVAPSFTVRDGSPSTATPHGLYFAELVQLGLVERQRNRFVVLDTDIMLNAIRHGGMDQLQDIAKLNAMAKRVGGLDAIIVGNLGLDAQGDWGGLDQASLLRCRLLDVRTGTIRAIGSLSKGERPRTLADAVYQGQSIELMRWTDGKLLPIGSAPYQSTGTPSLRR